MGRVINYKKIGGKPVSGEKNKLVFKARFEGEATAVDAYLVKQTGTVRYRLSKLDDSKVEVFYMVPDTALEEGQCYLLGELGTDLVYASKLTQNRFSNKETGSSKYYIGELPDNEEGIIANAETGK